MRRTAIVILFISITLISFGQTEKKTPTIKVLGNSRTMVKPDIGVLIIQVTNKNMNFSETLTGLNAKTKDVTKQILSVGFKENDIKTTDFQIRENRIYRNNSYIDSGYVATQNVKVEFKYSKDNITKILTTFSKSKTDFNLNFDFKLSDDLKAKSQQELIRLAIKDAKTKARTIADAADVKLKRVHEVSYGETFSTRYMAEASDARFKTMAANEPMQSFTPEDISLTDSVMMIWEIE